MILSWQVAALFANIPHPVLALLGEQGTGKSSATRLIVSVLDPSPVPCRKPPRDVDAWVTAAAGSWVVGLDNLSTISPWFSDSLCRAVTGDGDVRRRLYTDGDLQVFAFRRCVVFNGIDLAGLRGDLVDRMLQVDLARIDDTERVEESEMWPGWEKAHPYVLGALLTLAAEVLAVLPTVQLERRPRMADFATIVAAVDQVMSTDGLERYLGKRDSLAADSIEADGFMSKLMATIDGPWSGTSAELLAKVGTSEAKGWPGSARACDESHHQVGADHAAAWLDRRPGPDAGQGQTLGVGAMTREMPKSTPATPALLSKPAQTVVSQPAGWGRFNTRGRAHDTRDTSAITRDPTATPAPKPAQTEAARVSRVSRVLNPDNLYSKPWRYLASIRWPSSPGGITGDGRFAVLGCRGTISLWPGVDAAAACAEWLDRFACGGGCSRSHPIVDLNETAAA